MADLLEAWVGIAEPNILWFPIVSAQVITPAGTVPPTDLTTVEAIHFNVFRPDQPTVPVVWPGVVQSASAPDPNGVSTLMATHAFTTGDCPVEGRYQVEAVPVFAGGPGASTTMTLVVKQPYRS